MEANQKKQAQSYSSLFHERRDRDTHLPDQRNGSGWFAKQKLLGLQIHSNCRSVAEEPNLILDLSQDVVGEAGQIQLQLARNPGDFFQLDGQQLVQMKPIDRDVIESCVGGWNRIASPKREDFGGPSW